MRTIYLLLTESGHVDGWSSTAGMENEVAISLEVDHPFFNSPHWCWLYSDSQLVLDEQVFIDKAREEKVLELNERCQEVIMNGFYHEGDFFQFNDKDQTNFNQQLSILLLDESVNQIVWKTENNGIKVFTREQFIETCKAGERHKRNSIGKYWQLKAYVLTAPFQSVQEITAIDFDFQIPSGG